MSLEADIKWITSEISKVKDPELIKALKSLLKYNAKKENKDWAENLSQDEEEALEKALGEAKRGEFLSHLDVMKEAKERYNLK